MLETVALIILIFVFVSVFYGIIAIHDFPYEIAMHRNHPHQDAIHYAGWVSLFTLHAIWPFLWIWAALYRKDRGWGFEQRPDGSASSDHDMVKQIIQLEQRVAVLKNRAAADPQGEEPTPSRV